MEEMQATMEEMKKLQAHDEEVQYEMKQFHDGIFNTYNIIEFSADAIVTDVNENLLNLFQAHRSAFIDKHMSVFMGEEEFEKAWKTISRGRTYKVTTQIDVGGRKMDIHQTFMPVCDMHGKLLNVSLLAVHDQEAELLQHIEEMKTQEEEIRQTMEEMLATQEEMHNRENELKKVMDTNKFQLAKLDLIIDSSKMGMWDMQIVGGDYLSPKNIYTWSDEIRKMLGYSNEIDYPNTGESWSNGLHPEDIDRVFEAYIAHAKDRTGKTPYDVEYRLLKKNGEYAHFHDFGSTMRDEDGNPLRTVGAMKDITEEVLEMEKIRRREAELEDSMQWKQSLLDAMENPISVTDMDKKITFLNQATLNILGKTREEVLGKFCGDVWNLDICKDGRCGIECLKRGERKSEFSIGDKKFTTLANYIVDHDGNNIGHIEVIEDITHQKKGKK